MEPLVVIYKSDEIITILTRCLLFQFTLIKMIEIT